MSKVRSCSGKNDASGGSGLLLRDPTQDLHAYAARTCLRSYIMHCQRLSMDIVEIVLEHALMSYCTKLSQAHAASGGPARPAT